MDYQQLYYLLFAAVENAVVLLEQDRPYRAKEILIEAELAAEEKIMETEEPETPRKEQYPPLRIIR